MSDLKYILKRSALTVLLIFFAITVLFFIFRLLPGDYVSVLAMDGADPETIESLRAKWGLDEPLYIQYITYIENVLQGDLGMSHRYRQPVLQVTGRAIVNSFILVAPAITTAFILGSGFGTLLGTNRSEKGELWGIVPLTFIGTFPIFFMGILLIIVFSFWLNLFPTGGMAAVTQQGLPYSELLTSAGFWVHYFLPFLTIVVNMLYLPALTMRTSIVEVLGQDFIDYHRAKGLKRRAQMRHVMKHASLPVITQYPVSLSRAIGGMVVVEMVFNWPGIGYLLLQSVYQRDFPVVQFVFLLIAVWVILGNFVVDILYSSVDPRVTVEGQESN